MIRDAGQFHRGFSAVETLLALPILLFLGLGAVQFALVYHAKQALNYALIEAARAGSLGHALPEAVETGLAQGLVPYLYGAQDAGERVANLARARTHIALGRAQGWLVLEQLSPTPASFQDWAEPARDAYGVPIDGLLEIPNDNLAVRAVRTSPASGTAGTRAGEPIGNMSGQTLADANLLKLQLVYGVPVTVPVAGRLLSWALRAWDGCAMGQGRRYGALGLGAPSQGPAPRAWACAIYGDPELARSVGEVGLGVPRIPVRVDATVRMQTPAREGGAGRSMSQSERTPLNARGSAPRPQGESESSPSIAGVSDPRAATMTILGRLSRPTDPAACGS